MIHTVAFLPILGYIFLRPIWRGNVNFMLFFQIAEIPQDRVPLYGLVIEENFVLVKYTRCPRGSRDVSTCTRHYARAEFLRKFGRYS